MRNVAILGFALGIGLLGTACRVDMNVGDWIIPDKDSGHSGSGGSSGQNDGSSDDQDCVSQIQGGDTSCKDAGTWKSHASDACIDSGLALMDYLPKDECGEGLFRYVSYTCCPPATTPPPPPPPPPPTCESQVQGGETSCKDIGTWKSYAAEACIDSGLFLMNYTTKDECGDGLFRYVDYTCCSN